MVRKILTYFDISKWRLIYILLFIAAFALFVRVVYFAELAENPFFEHPIVDSQTYDEMAVKVAAGEEPFEGAFFQPPLYPYFLGLLYGVLGRTLGLARFAQMLLGVANALLVFAVGRKLFGRGIRLAAALLFSLYGTMLFFEGELLAPVLIVFLNLLLILSLLLLFERRTWWLALISGLLLAASSLAMAVILPFAIVILVYGFWRLRREEGGPSWKKIAILGLCFIIGIIVVIAPVAARNYVGGDDLVLISYNGGINFYVGNSPDYKSTVGIRPGYEWQALGREPILAGYEKPSEQSGYFIAKTFDAIKADFAGFMGNLARKLYLYMHGGEVMRNQEIYPFRQYSSLLSILIWKKVIAFPYGLLFPFAVVGIKVALFRKKRDASPVLLFIATHVAVIVIFFVTARYRMNILPFLIMFAVYGGVGLYSLFRERELKKAIFISLALAVALVVCNWRVGEMPSDFNADAYYNLGVQYMKQEKPEAKEMFEKAVELRPDYPEANGNLGIYYAGEGDHKAAIECFEKVLAQYPDDIEANINMGNELFALGDMEGAAARFRKVLKLSPGHPIAKENLKVVEARMFQGEAIKDIEEAIEANPEIALLLKELESDPNNPALLTNLGAAYLGVEKYALAVGPLSAAVRLAPGLIQARNNLGIALAELGDLEGARREFEIVLKIEPENHSAKGNLEYLDKIDKAL
ncbi:MAG: tetratricopeptide repeat protein [bacterium]|nr:tetratricopeptide repeat protein [bacterium]